MKRLLDVYLRVFHFWMRLPEKIRFLLVGGYNTVVSYILYAGFVYLFQGEWIQIALLLSFAISSVNSFLTQKFFVFGTRGHYLKEYSRCLLTWGISYGMNAVLLQVLLWGGFNPYLAQVIALIVITINSYFMLKYIAFRQNKTEHKCRG